MATVPYWKDAYSGNRIPAEELSEVARMRLADASRYAGETEKEAEAARAEARRLTEISDRATAQLAYWTRIAEIAAEVDARLAEEGDTVAVAYKERREAEEKEPPF